MKIAVVYATKTGTTREAARRLCEALAARGAETALCELGRDKPCWTADACAVGGSVRMGQWHKLARAFAKENETALLSKPAAFFACRCGADDTRALLAPQLGEKLAAASVWTDSVGGEMDISKQKGFDRFVAKMVAKSPAGEGMSVNALDDARIAALADALTGACGA